MRCGMTAGITGRRIASMNVLDSKILTGPRDAIERDIVGHRPASACAASSRDHMVRAWSRSRQSQGALQGMCKPVPAACGQ